MASHSRPIANIMCGNKKDKPKKDMSKDTTKSTSTKK
jgi:hypothetical protein